MDRFLLDLDNLPKAKKEVILQITSSYSERSKVAFIKSLIFLGFSTIKQSDLDVTTANIAKSSSGSSTKYRVILKNTPIAAFLKTLTSQTSKRSCVYAFLYSGISNYIEYMEAIQNNADRKIIESIEKKLFLCGLSDHFSNSINISVQAELQRSPQAELQRSPEVKVAIAASPAPIVNENKKTISNETNHPVIAVELNQPINDVTPPIKQSKKPKFQIDGV